MDLLRSGRTPWAPAASAVTDTNASWLLLPLEYGLQLAGKVAAGGLALAVDHRLGKYMQGVDPPRRDTQQQLLATDVNQCQPVPWAQRVTADQSDMLPALGRHGADPAHQVAQ